MRRKDIHIVSDHTLFEQLRKDNRLAFSQLFDRHWETMVDNAIKILKDKEAALDVVQEVFIELWKKRQVLHVDHIKPYLYQSVKHKVIDYIRKQRIPLTDLDYVDQFVSGSFTEDWLAQKELQSIVEQTIQQLPDQCRLVFKLSRFDELTNKEIAEQLNISVRTVENHISKALKYLRPRLDATLSLILFFYL